MKKEKIIINEDMEFQSPLNSKGGSNIPSSRKSLDHSNF